MDTTIFQRFNEAFNYLKQSGVIDGQRDLAIKLRISRYSISMVMKGIERYSTSAVIERFSFEYDKIINEDWLYDGKGEMLMKNTD